MQLTRALLKTHSLFMSVNVVVPTKAGLKLGLPPQIKSGTGVGAEGKSEKEAGAGAVAGAGAGAGEVEGAGAKTALEAWVLHGFQARGGTGQWAGI